MAQSALSAGFKLVALMGDHGGGQEEMARVAQALDAQSKKSGARVVYVGDLYSKADAQFDELLAKRGITSNNFYRLYDMAMLGLFGSVPAGRCGKRLRMRLPCTTARRPHR